MSTASLLLAALLFFPVIAVAEEKKNWPKDPDAQVLEQVESIERVGREIHRRQQMYLRGVEALSPKIGRRKATSAVWILNEVGANSRVAFAREDRSVGMAWVADVELQDDASATVTTKPSRLLTPEESDVLAAIKVAREAGRSGCSKVYDAVVVPIEGGDMDVFVLATSKKKHQVVLGGHARVRVSSNGAAVREIERYSKSCMVMDVGNPEVVSLMTSHIVSDLPAPTHVFASLTQRRPIYIATRSHLWIVERGEVKSVPR